MAAGGGGGVNGHRFTFGMHIFRAALRLSQPVTEHAARIKFGVWIAYCALFAVFIMLPIASSFVFSMNSSRFPSLPLGGLDFRWYREALSDPKDFAALGRTFFVGIAAAAMATCIGAAAAYTDFRYRFFGKTGFLILILSPPTVPLAILGLGFLVYFSQLGISGNAPAVALAHTVICIPFAMALVRLRLAQMNKNLEAAAWNLGAGEWEAVRYVILPFIKPALIAAFLITAALSFDEFAVAWFVSGISETLPVRVLNLLAGPVSPRINVIGTAAFSATITMIIIAYAYMARDKK